METRKTPNTDLEVCRLALGCMGLGGGWVADTKLTTDHERQAREFLDAAEEIGANFFDHANIYGRGRAEEVFGRVLKERPYLRDRIVLQSKCGIRWVDNPPGTPMRYDFSREHILESVDAILGRLATDRLDILLLHRPDPLWEGEEIAAAFTPNRLRACAKALSDSLSREEWYFTFCRRQGRTNALGESVRASSVNCQDDVLAGLQLIAGDLRNA
jgi:predicted oxidoreductase